MTVPAAAVGTPPMSAPRLAVVLAPLLLAALASTVRAQVDRYELGLRLRAFERELATTTDAARRQGAFRALDRAVQAFFRLDTAGVASAVEDATWALRGRAPTPAERAARALLLRLPVRLVASGDTVVPAQLLATPSPRARDDDSEDDDADAANDGATTKPLAGAVLTLRLGDRELVRVALDAPRPTTIALPLAGVPPGDHVLRWTIRQNDVELAVREQAVSIAADLDARMQRLEATADQTPEPADLERATLDHLAKVLRTMTRARGEETILPGARLLAEAEALAALPADGRYYAATRPGQFWLRVPTAGGNAVVRLCVPAGLDTATAVPLVVALHGAGGSENLFCDGYGDGEIVRQCDRRGWLLVAPRSAGMTGVDVAALVDALAARFPVDRARIAVVGHSMGAMQTVATAMQAPERYAAIAAISGGGGVRKQPGLDRLPFFVAAGSADFGKAGSSALRRQLEAVGVAVEYREYQDVEHLAVVQVALPDVFAFFDRVLAR